MKKLITLLLSSFLIIQVSGQEKAIAYIDPAGSIDAYTAYVFKCCADSIWVTGDSSVYAFRYIVPPVLDTMPSELEYFIFKDNETRYDTTEVQMLVNNTETGPITYSLKGYAVREGKYYHEKIYYLDAEKKRLSPSIIVWMAK